ncbi:phosphatase PAP2 family protein [Actinoallomurus oryzae]|uniref:Phosphatase PAP2 family protein n=2 Tax=Actinoallomurus oryzae TaxID=502180 RepID=A0ABP8R5U0_9ACTN
MGIMSSSAVAPVATGDATEAPGDKPAGRRPGVWREILLIALCYTAYSIVRNLVPTTHTAALRLGGQILRLEHLLHIGFELPLNHLFVRDHWIGVVANYYYSTLHFIVTPTILAWLYVRHQDRYVFYRRLIFATTVLALVGFYLLPLAPPRMLPGYVDTVLAWNTHGLYASGASPVGSVSNQYAAMPSLHTGWALWCAIAVSNVIRRPWAKVLPFLYPVATVIVILGTANHYFLDAVGGAVTLGCGYLAARGVRLVIPRLGPVARVFSTE